MKKKLLISCFLFFLSLLRIYSQQLVINEVSQGPSGTKEYVELIVVGSPTCNGIPTMDLRGYYIDDNNGTFATGAGVGIASGCIRFANVAFWSAIPYGTIIVIHNDADSNPLMPANDLSMVDGNCLLVIPVSNATLFEKHTAQPSNILATYPTTGFVAPAATAWNTIGMSNTQGDSFQTRDASSTLVHAVSWGSNSSSTIVYVNASSAVGGTVFSMTNGTNNNPALSSNWSTGATTTNETPGAPNNSANAAWINSMNNGCTIIQPFGATTSSTNPGCTCNGLASITPTGAIAPYTYTWAPSGGNAASASALCAGVHTVTTTSSNNCTLTATYTLTNSAALTTATAATNPICFGSTGSATITPSGIAGPYTYTWTPSVSTSSAASGLTAGNYTVSVGVGGCISTKTITIAAPPSAITINTSVTQPDCFGVTGSATVSASGGPSTTYGYAWNPSASTASTTSGLGAGTQTIIVTSGACSNSAIITVTTAPTAIIINTFVTQPNCTNATGSATVSVIGGPSTAYGYAWNPSASTASTSAGLTGATTQTITVTSGLCTNSAVVTITAAPVAITLATAVTQPNCTTSTGSASVAASGGTGAFTYAWNPSASTASTASGMGAGTQTITVTSGACSNSAVITVTAAPAAIVINTSVTQPLCFGSTGSATVSATGGTGAFTYAWNPASSTASTASGLGAGTQTITVTSGACSNSAIITVTAAPAAIVINTSVTQPLCFGSTGSATVSASGGTGGYGYAWNPSASTASTTSGLGAGSQTITVTSGACSNSAIIVVATPPSSISITPTVTNVQCFGGATGVASVTASGGTGPYTYTWTPSVSVSSLGTGLIAGNYSVTVNDFNNCQQTVTFNITQPSSSVSAVITTSNSSCTSATGSASVTAAGGSAGFTYNWLPSGGTNSIATAMAPGVYSVVITDANACNFTATTSIFTISGPTLNLTTTSITCFGLSNGSATASINGGTAPISFAWLPLTNTLSSVNGLASGSYTLNITDANSCTTSSIFQIIQPTALALILNNSNITCQSLNSGSIVANANGGVGSYIYNWLPAVSSSSVATNLTQGVYSITVTDNNNCVSTASVQLTNPVALNASVAVTPVSCNLPASGSATAVVQGGNGVLNFNWQPSTNTNSVATGLTSGLYTLTVTDPLSCINTQTFLIAPPSAVTLAINIASVNCKGASTGSISVSAGGGNGVYQYSWLPSVSNSSTALNLQIGTYVINVTDALGCNVSQTVDVTEPAQAVAVNGVSSLSLCSGQSATLNVVAVGGTPQYSYNWQPALQGSNLVTLSPTTTTVYSLVVSDVFNCQSAPKTITVNVAGALSLVTNTNIIACSGGVVTLTASAISSFPSSLTYTWLPINVNTTSVSLTANSSTQYTLIAADACSTRSAVTTVSVENRPQFPNLPTSKGCAPVCVNYKDESLINSGIIKNWFWSFSDGQVTSEITPTVCFSNAGSYSGTLTLQTINNCLYTYPKFTTIKVAKIPIADFTSNIGNTSIEYNSTFIFTNTSLYADSITWFANNTPTVANSIIKTYDDVGTYPMVLVAVNKASGCADTVIKVFTVKPEFTFYVPNCFNVGEFGVSKLFQAKGTGWDEGKFNMSIYDRWGELIFKTTNCYDGWDGTYKGVKVKDDVYIWKIDVQDNNRKLHNYVGHVTIIK